MDEWLANSDYSKEVFLKHFEKMYKEHGYIKIKITTGKQRTNQQSKAMHVYCGLLAEAMNDAGYDIRKVLEMRPTLEIPWSKDLVKENLWRPIQKAMLNKESTKDPDRSEYTKVYETLNNFTATHFGIGLPFPSKEDMQ